MTKIRTKILPDFAVSFFKNRKDQECMRLTGIDIHSAFIASSGYNQDKYNALKGFAENARKGGHGLTITYHKKVRGSYKDYFVDSLALAEGEKQLVDLNELTKNI